MEYNNLIVEKNEGICVIKINRPKALNALNEEVLCELEWIFDDIKNDHSVKVIILTGEGKAFVAGADIVLMSKMTAGEGAVFSAHGNRVFRKIELLNKPVIAAINGFAFGGGCELSMACDLRIASTKAKFAQPEVGLGIIPGHGGTQRLPRIIGVTKAKELIYTGDIIDAEEALNLGLLNKVVEPEKLIDEAKALAARIIKNSMIAVAYGKEVINRGMQVDMDTALSMEANFCGMCFSTKDQKEGMAAFVEKRKANFIGE